VIIFVAAMKPHNPSSCALGHCDITVDGKNLVVIVVKHNGAQVIPVFVLPEVTSKYINPEIEHIDDGIVPIYF